MDELKRLRGEIDGVDASLLSLLSRRMELVERAAEQKEALSLPVRDEEREAELLSGLQRLAPSERWPYLRPVFEELLAQSRRRQREGRLRCGLVGHPLGHSYSPMLHRFLGAYSYELFDLQEEELPRFFKAGVFDGLNVTVPYKKAVLPYCAALSETARRIGAVNTIVKRADGTLFGHNTDYDGFVWLLRQSGFDVKGEKALLLGTGGAAATVKTALYDLGVGELVPVSRRGPVDYESVYEHRDARLLINATPVGTYPNTAFAPVDLRRLPGLRLVLDLNYNPARTQLLLDAERLGIPGLNGLGMLVAQARAASELFTGQKLPETLVKELCHKLERQNKNIALIGMPGCGKTTVGQALSEKLGRPFADLDSLLEREAGRSIPEIFAKEGEEGFRRRETELLRRYGKESGLVLACGGGVVTREENRELLRQNSLVVWLQRELDKLPTEGRPLSQSRGLAALYAEREPLYRVWSDIAAENNAAVAEAVDAICAALG